MTDRSSSGQVGAAAGSQPQPIARRPVVGLPVAAVDYGQAVQATLDQARLATGAYLVEAANTHVVALARSDPAFGNAMARFDLILPDGMPLVWALNWRRREGRLSDRVYGPTLMLRCFAASEGDPEVRHFLLGGSQEQILALENNLSTRYPRALICGTYSPPFGEWPKSETSAIAERIKAAHANVVWVGLGCPKQEFWMAENKAFLPPAAYLGVGAAFAFHSGNVPQAPPFLQKCGLEWAYRLAREPRRLWKRYLVFNSLFLYYWIRQQLASSPNAT
ncbi:WecB/TagA/CpsF family glycosyltransferase [soil metagenome]